MLIIYLFLFLKNLLLFHLKFFFSIKDGTKKIYDRYDAGRKTLTDMIKIFKSRAEGEESYIKHMTMIGNKTHTLREGG